MFDVSQSAGRSVFDVRTCLVKRGTIENTYTDVQQSNSKKHVFQHNMVNIEHAFTFAQHTKYKFDIVFYFCILLYTLDSDIRNVCYPSMQE